MRVRVRVYVRARAHAVYALLCVRPERKTNVVHFLIAHHIFVQFNELLNVDCPTVIWPQGGGVRIFK